MKKIYLVLVSLSFIQLGIKAQYDMAILNQNNVEAIVSNGGVFLNDPATQSPGFEYPKGSNNHLIYANAFWFKAADSDGNNKLSAQLYNMGEDIFPGTLKPNSATPSPSQNPTKLIHQVGKAEIQNHIDNFSDPGYTVPSSIADWPAHGDVNAGYDFYLAPFVDVNGDGIYTPSDGDYPKIRGDKATYMILNDKQNIHGSGGEPMGVECHFMFYQHSSTNYLNNTIFLNVKVINRSTQDYPEFKVGCFMDPDIGFGADDAVGCDTTKKVMYAYNYYDNDNDYGNIPPAVGVVNLNQSMDVFGYFSNDMPQMNLPSSAADFQNYLDGKWRDGLPFTSGGNGYGGNENTKYMFPGNPNNQGEWSEIDEEITPSDKKMFMTANIGPLNSGKEKCLDYAFIVGSGDDHLENVNNLLDVATDVQNFFNSQQDFICQNYEETLDVNTNKANLDFPTVFPNPSTGQITIDFSGDYNIEIHALDGRKVFEKSNIHDVQEVYTTLDTGSYIISILQNGNRYTEPLVIQ